MFDPNATVKGGVHITVIICRLTLFCIISFRFGYSCGSSNYAKLYNIMHPTHTYNFITYKMKSWGRPIELKLPGEAQTCLINRNLSV